MTSHDDLRAAAAPFADLWFELEPDCERSEVPAFVVRARTNSGDPRIELRFADEAAARFAFNALSTHIGLIRDKERTRVLLEAALSRLSPTDRFEVEAMFPEDPFGVADELRDLLRGLGGERVDPLNDPDL